MQSLWLRENLSTLLRSAFEPLGVFLTVKFSRSVVSYSLQPHGLQHARLLCSSPTPRAFSNSWPSSWWCHPTMSSLLSPSPPAFTISQEQGLFQWVSSLHQVAKYWSFSFNISPSNEYSGPISFRMDWLDLLAVQGTLKNLLHHSSKASILRRSAFFMVQLSHPFVTSHRLCNKFTLFIVCHYLR